MSSINHEQKSEQKHEQYRCVMTNDGVQEFYMGEQKMMEIKTNGTVNHYKNNVLTYSIKMDGSAVIKTDINNVTIDPNGTLISIEKDYGIVTTINRGIVKLDRVGRPDNYVLINKKGDIQFNGELHIECKNNSRIHMSQSYFKYKVSNEVEYLLAPTLEYSYYDNRLNIKGIEIHDSHSNTYTIDTNGAIFAKKNNFPSYYVDSNHIQLDWFNPNKKSVSRF